jgi:hypothetical protein
MQRWVHRVAASIRKHGKTALYAYPIAQLTVGIQLGVAAAVGYLAGTATIVQIATFLAPIGLPLVGFHYILAIYCFPSLHAT